jgi:sulfopropanediol 3-dehydrogenase
MPLYLKSAPTKTFADTTQLDVAERVRSIVGDIREEGDVAVRRYAEQFDNWSPESYRLSDEEIEGIIGTLQPQVIEDIKFVQTQVRRFAQAQRDSLVDIEVETLPGVLLGQKHVPVRAAPTFPAASTRSPRRRT